jgi:hypothetical protein
VRAFVIPTEVEESRRGTLSVSRDPSTSLRSTQDEVKR